MEKINVHTPYRATFEHRVTIDFNDEVGIRFFQTNHLDIAMRNNSVLIFSVTEENIKHFPLSEVAVTLDGEVLEEGDAYWVYDALKDDIVATVYDDGSIWNLPMYRTLEIALEDIIEIGKAKKVKVSDYRLPFPYEIKLK